MAETRLRPPDVKQDRSAATREALLDAAVAELLESGYTKLTASAVALRAGVSRGAQQHHFVHKDVLVAEAMVHLAGRQAEQLRARIADALSSGDPVMHALDAIYELYGGPLFGAMLELSLAARHEPRLGGFIAEQERQVSNALHDQADAVFTTEVTGGQEFRARWGMALATARGLALLKVLGHAPAGIDRQWAYARQELLALFASS